MSFSKMSPECMYRFLIAENKHLLQANKALMHKHPPHRPRFSENPHSEFAEPKSADKEEEENPCFEFIKNCYCQTFKGKYCKGKKPKPKPGKPANVCDFNFSTCMCLRDKKSKWCKIGK